MKTRQVRILLLAALSLCPCATLAARVFPSVSLAADGGAPRPALDARPAPLKTILADIKANGAGARAVLVNVWATWCDPCREEMPDILRFYRENRARGLRLVLISADDDDRGAEVRSFLEKSVAAAGLAGDFDALLYLKKDDDMRFIDGLDPSWGGALPASFHYDGHGQRRRSWLGPISYDELREGFADWLTTNKAKIPPPGGGNKSKNENKNETKTDHRR